MPPSPEPTKPPTRQILLQAGRQLLGQKGYHHMGIQEVLQRAQVPKGSFYHFFASKEEFCLQILDQDAVSHHRQLRQYLEDPNYSPRQRLQRYFAMKCHEFQNQGCREGCLMANLGQELADQVEVFRAKVDQFFRDWQAALARCLQESQAVGELAQTWDTQELAEYLIIGWEGAILRMKTAKNTDPLHAFVTITFEHLLTPIVGEMHHV